MKNCRENSSLHKIILHVSTILSQSPNNLEKAQKTAKLAKSGGNSAFLTFIVMVSQISIKTHCKLEIFVAHVFGENHCALRI